MGTWSGYQKHLQHRSWSASTCLDSGSFVSAFCFAVFAATTRKDAIGDAARSTGNAAISTFESAKTINNEHNITGKAYEAATASVAKAREVNSQYKITDKLGQAFNFTASKAKELEEKHNITSKVGGAVALGMDSLTKAMGKGNKSGDSVAPASSGFPDVPK
eukprot:CAMPEP_0114260496 /NCGR_PEP_ID=MMETSP0058-20121206/20525_1 /TAXON_ID=36894 /ORGANISM="Pyramimonas parkeae, CCMP726" /LENGTH=161 /DNA_ID=CAMNT_0001375749 /DNA_START=1290 /DNA_END=1775 /DNA_ORIENTATION=+